MHPSASPTAEAGASPKQGLSRGQRLVRRALFAECYRQGRKSVGRYMVLWLREGEDASLRLGVVASRKVGNAVARNRARRRLREIYRRRRHCFRGPFDVVLVARRAIGEARAGEVEEELMHLAARAGLAPGSEAPDHGECARRKRANARQPGEKGE